MARGRSSLIPWLVTLVTVGGLAWSGHTSAAAPTPEEDLTRARVILAKARRGDDADLDPDEMNALAERLKMRDPTTAVELVTFAIAIKAKRGGGGGLPNLSRDQARAQEILVKARAGNDSDLDPEEMYGLASRLRTIDPKVAAELAGYAELIKAKRGQTPLPFGVGNNVGDVDTRPAPGFLPPDLGARVAYLLNPNFTPTKAQVTAVLLELEKFQGFLGEKESLKRLRVRLS